MKTGCAHFGGSPGPCSGHREIYVNPCQTGSLVVPKPQSCLWEVPQGTLWGSSGTLQRVPQGLWKYLDKETRDESSDAIHSLFLSMFSGSPWIWGIQDPQKHVKSDVLGEVCMFCCLCQHDSRLVLHKVCTKCYTCVHPRNSMKLRFRCLGGRFWGFWDDDLRVMCCMCVHHSREGLAYVYVLPMTSRSQDHVRQHVLRHGFWGLEHGHSGGVCVHFVHTLCKKLLLDTSSVQLCAHFVHTLCTTFATFRGSGGRCWRI